MITSEDIKKYSEWIKNGAEIEDPKMELKQEWWNLNSDLPTNEFLKDVTAMANTPGSTGHIIIGIDKHGELHNANIPIDPSKIRGIICKHIQDPMNIEVYPIQVDDKMISVIEVPQSLNKPHVIKEYRRPKQTINMFIPVRKGTSINAANKYDLELMYLERNNKIIVDYGIDIIVANMTNVNASSGSNINYDYEIGIPATVVNKGIYVNCIKSGKFIIEEPAGLEIKYEYEIRLIMIDDLKYYFANSNFPKINSNDVIRGFFVFGLNKQEWSTFEYRHDKKLKGYIELVDIKENKFVSNTFSFR
ncbi:AlbA family DNA-binding domain-containing protein [Clostridium coskatii]|jgi:hypothetical protein|uniref:Divergent AAA domain protein n=1 Tax=Clostridium coskatii TaxID=1705578 RepID=A0A166TD84_9CLOT|nr:ATP-binding protein [Clostridium coskatii]OAA93538.1 Divergent AAA domain protein [Clostridium coskatii]OBR96327.1 divergent AAA domain protein [Clostridium coskatii]